MRKNHICICLIICTIFGFVGCKSEANWKKTASGLEYLMAKDVEGPTAQKDQFVDISMQYRTPKDSIVFNSFTRTKPLNFKITENLFRGSLLEPLTLMSKGDSALFKIKASQVYGERVPTYVKPDEVMTFVIRLDAIRTAEEHRAMREAERAKELQANPAAANSAAAGEIKVTPNQPQVINNNQVNVKANANLPVTKGVPAEIKVERQVAKPGH